MKSDDLKFVLDAPPGVVENVIFAPCIGFPLSADANDGELGDVSDDVVVDVTVGVSTSIRGFSFFILGSFGIVIVNCAEAAFASANKAINRAIHVSLVFMSPPIFYQNGLDVCQNIDAEFIQILTELPIKICLNLQLKNQIRGKDLPRPP